MKRNRFVTSIILTLSLSLSGRGDAAPTAVSVPAAASAVPGVPVLAPEWRFAIENFTRWLGTPAGIKARGLRPGLDRLHRLDLTEPAGQATAALLARHLPEDSRMQLLVFGLLGSEGQADVLKQIEMAQEQAAPEVLRLVSETKAQKSQTDIRETAELLAPKLGSPAPASLRLGKDRQWRMEPDAPKEAADVLAAVKVLEKRGIHLNISRILLERHRARSDPSTPLRAGPAGPLRFDGQGALYIESDFVQEAAAQAKSQKLKTKDKVVHALVKAQLEGGMAQAARLGSAETEAAGLGLDRRLSADRAVRLYNANQFTHFLPLLLELDAKVRPGLLMHSQAVESGSGEELRSLTFDPETRTVYTLDKSGRVEARRVDENGNVDPRLLGARRVDKGAVNITVDPQRRMLISVGDSVTLYRIGKDGRPGPVATSAEVDGKYRPWKAASDPRSGALFLLSRAGLWTLDTEKGGQGKQVSAKEAQIRDIALDPEGRRLFLLWRSPDGHAGLSLHALDERGRPGAQVQELDGHSIERMVWDPGQKALILSRRSGHIELRPLSAEGLLSEQASGYGADLQAATYTPVGSAFLGIQGKEIRRFSIEEHKAAAARPRPGAWERQAVADTLAGLLDASTDGRSDVVQHITFLLKGLNDMALVRAVWHRLVRGLGNIHEPSRLTAVPGSARWFPGEKQRLEERMPTLVRILSSPRQTGRMLYALSLLRIVNPFELANNAVETPPEWSKIWRREFKIKELVVLPVGESFRRHIFKVEDENGLDLVELKMPGQMEKKKEVNVEHFTVARQLWLKFPKDPGVIKPLMFRQFKGRVWLYDSMNRFTAWDPLGLALFRYEPGKRYRNSRFRFIDRAAKRLGMMPETLRLRALTDMAVFAIRFHRLGWSGNDDEGPDMHDENVSVTLDGRGLSPADFGAAHKEKLSLPDRADQTLNLLGEPGLKTRKAIYPRVLRRMTAGVKDPAQRTRIRKEVRSELGLTP